jgi:hypothetical protein
MWVPGSCSRCPLGTLQWTGVWTRDWVSVIKSAIVRPASKFNWGTLLIVQMLIMPYSEVLCLSGCLSGRWVGVSGDVGSLHCCRQSLVRILSCFFSSFFFVVNVSFLLFYVLFYLSPSLIWLFFAFQCLFWMHFISFISKDNFSIHFSLFFLFLLYPDTAVITIKCWISFCTGYSCCLRSLFCFSLLWKSFHWFARILSISISLHKHYLKLHFTIRIP